VDNGGTSRYWNDVGYYSFIIFDASGKLHIDLKKTFLG
jgi:hypothetical protein